MGEWDQRLDRRAMAERLDAAIARLPEEQREVTVMRHRLGLSHEEMCAALGVPLGTVKSRLARALTTLRQELKDWDR